MGGRKVLCRALNSALRTHSHGLRVWYNSQSKKILVPLVAVVVGVAVIMWYVNDSRQFDFGRAFGIRLGMPVDEFNARYGANFKE